MRAISAYFGSDFFVKLCFNLVSSEANFIPFPPPKSQLYPFLHESYLEI
uniref:Uncharacterized protein n=1 Tax=Podoviridae sp. ct8Lf7 TaxID=2827723 RepID=A0A8S5S0I8_9CAUD|nr:MAG TPA: hypothetical protein [Podoviridae sp. ct8Lf7]